MGPVVVQIDDQREKRIRDLKNNRQIYIEYLRMKVEEGDHHGAADACMDLREVDAELRGLRGR